MYLIFPHHDLGSFKLLCHALNSQHTVLEIKYQARCYTKPKCTQIDKGGYFDSLETIQLPVEVIK